MALPKLYEGTAEEIAEQLLSSNLTGKLRAIVTPDDHGSIGSNGNDESLDKVLAALLEEADRLEHETPAVHTDPHEKMFGEIMDKKYRRMGFKL